MAPPRPGAHRDQVCWRSRNHWLTVVAPAAIAHRAAPLRRHSVDPATFRRYLAVLAAAADHATGRGIQLTTAQIAQRVGCSDVHVRRCRRIAEELGLYRIVTPGRLMTRAERIHAWRTGSPHRGLANEAVLCVPTWLLPHLVTPATPPAGEPSSDPCVYRDVDDVRPPSRSPVGTPVTVSDQVLADTSARKPAAPAATTTPSPTKPATKPRSNRRWQAGYDLAVAVVARVGWLRGTPPGHLAQALARFASARLPWRAGDVVAALDQLHARLGWSSPTRSRLRRPAWALFAWYLRQVDPDADHPGGGGEWDEPAACAGVAPRHAPGALAAHVSTGHARRVVPGEDAAAGAAAYLTARAALRSG